MLPTLSYSGTLEDEGLVIMSLEGKGGGSSPYSSTLKQESQIRDISST